MVKNNIRQDIRELKPETLRAVSGNSQVSSRLFVARNKVAGLHKGPRMVSMKLLCWFCNWMKGASSPP